MANVKDSKRQTGLKAKQEQRLVAVARLVNGTARLRSLAEANRVLIEVAASGESVGQSELDGALLIAGEIESLAMTLVQRSHELIQQESLK